MSTTPPAPAPSPAAPGDTRSKGVAVTALVLAIVGLVLALLGFVPLPWLGIVGVLLGGLVLLAAFVVSIVGLVGARNGGKPLSITALVLSVLGGVVAGFALIVALVFTGLSVSDSAASSTPSPASTEGAEAGGEAADLTAGEQAFIDEVRPQVDQTMQEVDPSLTPDLVAQAFPDESLLMIGQALLATGEEGIDSFVDQTLSTAGDTISEEQLRAMYQSLYDAAVAHLQ